MGMDLLELTYRRVWKRVKKCEEGVEGVVEDGV